MGTSFQVTFDCADPDSLAGFWAEALGYLKQPPPEGHASWEDFLRHAGIPEERWTAFSAVIDPDGKGPRIFFQKVPEPKTVKNRIHLDVNVGAGLEGEERRQRVEQEAERVAGLGATKVRPFDQDGEFWIVMQDPEGNEFCLQ